MSSHRILTQCLLQEWQYVVILGRAGHRQLVIDHDQRIGKPLALSAGVQVGEPGLYLRIGQVTVLDLDGLSVPQADVKLEDLRGLRRRPGRPSAARLLFCLVTLVAHYQ